jgi:hypothetical protein
MKKGDTVKFKNIVDKGDETARMILLENPDGGRVLVEDICSLPIRPTRVLPVKDLEVTEQYAHIKEIISQNTGGCCMVDFIVLNSGKVIGIGMDDSIGIYANKEEAGI